MKSIVFLLLVVLLLCALVLAFISFIKVRSFAEFSSLIEETNANSKEYAAEHDVTWGRTAKRLYARYSRLNKSA